MYAFAPFGSGTIPSRRRLQRRWGHETQAPRDGAVRNLASQSVVAAAPGFGGREKVVFRGRSPRQAPQFSPLFTGSGPRLQPLHAYMEASSLGFTVSDG